MGLKKNKYYWRVSLENPEPVGEDLYVSDDIIVLDENFIERVHELRDLIIGYCVIAKRSEETAAEILDEIYELITSTDNIQYTEFVAFWKAMDMSFSIFKRFSTDTLQKSILKELLEKYCERRRKLYDRLGYSNVTVQALYDNGASRRKGVSGIEKIKTIVKDYLGDIPKSNSLEDIHKFNTTYFLPDSRNDRELFSQFVKKFKLEFSYGKRSQNKMPDFLLKHNKHFLIIEAKHIKEPGGGQDKSVGELIDFIQQEENNDKIHYVSFMDGIYFNLLISNPVQRGEITKKFQCQRSDIERALKQYKNNFFVNTAGLKALIKDLRTLKS